MHYLLNRARALFRQLLTVRGALIGAVVVAWLVALVTPSPWSQIFAVLGLVALAVLLLLISARQADTHDRLVAAPAAEVPAAQLTPEQMGPALEARRARLAAAHAQVAASRERSAIERARGALPAPPRNEPPGGDAEAPPPTVTVVVPCYNEERFVADTLESVLRQSFTDWECIVVDDASTDGSVAEIWRYTARDPRFRLIRHKQNAGLSASRNTGLRAARGSFITFLDSDDLLMEDSLLDRVEKIVERMAPELAGVYCGIAIAPETVTLDDLPPYEPGARTAVIDFVGAKGECPFNAHAPLLRTEVVRLAGGFDEDMRFGAEDWDLWYRILRNGYVFPGTGRRTAIYRQKQRSMAKANALEHVREARRLTDAAYAEVDPELLWESGIVPFDRPLPEYEHQITIAKRVIQYAATAMIDGGAETARRTLSGLEPLPPSTLAAQVIPERRIDDGFRRALGLSQAELDELSAEVSPLKHQLVRQVHDAVETPKTMSAEMAAPSFEVLFAPQTSDQAAMMLEIDRVVGSQRSTAFLVTDRISGVQGVADVLAAANVPTLSVNEWALRAGEAAMLVVAFPREAVVEEITAAFVERGGEVIEVSRPADAVMTVPATPRYETPMTTSPPESVATAIEESLGRGDGRVAVSEPWSLGPLVWVGAASEDPDRTYALEEYPNTTFDADRLREFKDRHRGERCVIIGNGPSLNDLDLHKLADENTIGVNGIFYADLGFDLTYYVVEDTAVVKDNLEAIQSYPAGHKFFPSIYRSQIGPLDNASYFMMNRGYYQTTSPSYCVPRFSTDITQRVYSGQSVTIINLQLAYYLGFTEVALIGMDFSYTIPADAIKEGDLLTSQSDDPNHFHPEYFGKGKVWKDPKLDRVLANYQLAKLIYEADGRRIVNASAGGKLELFDRVPYDELFGSRGPA